MRVLGGEWGVINVNLIFPACAYRSEGIFKNLGNYSAVALWDAPLEPTETSGAVGGGSGSERREERRNRCCAEKSRSGGRLAEGHWSSNTKFSGLLMGEVTFLLPLPPSSSANC